MLKQRVITALVLALILIGAVVWLPASGFQLFIAGICLIGAWEWSNFAGITSALSRAVYVLVIALLMAAVYGLSWSQGWIVWVSLLWWVLAFWLVLKYPANSEVWSRQGCLFVLGVCVLIPAWSALLLLRLHPYFHFLFCVMVVLVASADIGAYFCGKAYGKTKLAEQVSPNKTWEGFWGGVGLSSILSLVIGVVLYMQGFLGSTLHLFILVPACMLLAVLSVVGDLFESMCKRQLGIKDSGSILPGHGGILDRIDGFTAAAPAFMVLVLLLESF
jgi:phosphatidate cytidylyltransferase